MEYLTLSTLLLILDLGQTKDIIARPDRIETNYILGKYPSNRDVNIYFASAIAANAAVKFVLPKRKAKHVWRAVSIVQASYITNNLQLGLKVKF